MTLATSEKVLRRDAAENRQRLLDAAAAVFSERGLEAGVDEIARVAGVGMGTLYRRFPTKDALISEIVRQLLIDLLAIAKSALAAPHGEGLEQLLYGTGAVQASNRGCLARLWNDDETIILKQQFRRDLVELLRLAKLHGRIREDATLTDLDLMFWAMRGAVETTRGVTDSAWRRILAIMLAGLRPGADHLDEPSMTDEEYTHLTAHLNPARRDPAPHYQAH
ncbi:MULTISPECIES: TetR/AcrR family transcriptional regulator [Actinomycetes]|uniref:TetR/AcrR family transcriptional regulator n=1 Tax=Actinomycetes TaxID=1760 RepID=UPI0004BEF6CC|nr:MULTISPECIES: TetR/AcrR family transcriptional regulator [Actinomycetes]